MMTPNRHKMALLTWAIIYPLITLLIWGLEPVLSGLPLPLRTLMITTLFVPIMSYVVMPYAQARLSQWLMM